MQCEMESEKWKINHDMWADQYRCTWHCIHFANSSHLDLWSNYVWYRVSYFLSSFSGSLAQTQLVCCLLFYIFLFLLFLFSFGQIGWIDRWWSLIIILHLQTNVLNRISYGIHQMATSLSMIMMMMYYFYTYEISSLNQ